MRRGGHADGHDLLGQLDKILRRELVEERLHGAAHFRIDLLLGHQPAAAAGALLRRPGRGARPELRGGGALRCLRRLGIRRWLRTQRGRRGWGEERGLGIQPRLRPGAALALQPRPRRCERRAGGGAARVGGVLVVVQAGLQLELRALPAGVDGERADKRLPLLRRGRSGQELLEAARARPLLRRPGALASPRRGGQLWPELRRPG
mmetsp:Transcript_97154/g.271250  ORF Transcript_97154/g.271250 Transcript_97154/m.271250 type:complete len:206 (+) Transcript_97154:2127-2744(+)